MPSVWHRLDRIMGSVIAPAGWLVIPVSLLLFLQWPLRDLLHAWSVQANDLAQWLFALYVAFALSHATRAGTHLAVDGWARRFRPAVQTAIRCAGAVLCVLPWAGFVLIAGTPQVWRSVRGLEAFAETSDPGYFIVKLAAWILALLACCQALLDALRPRGA